MSAFIVLAAIGFIAWIAYDMGYDQGYDDGRESR